ncbi:hypothetical protein B0H13DRAFT_1972741 [Mycena leptocephala]|nr:hypothetical protein B0H13DRAFT_1972741 [Mycena leptocephala]
MRVDLSAPSFVQKNSARLSSSFLLLRAIWCGVVSARISCSPAGASYLFPFLLSFSFSVFWALPISVPVYHALSSIHGGSSPGSI